MLKFFESGKSPSFPETKLKEKMAYYDAMEKLQIEDSYVVSKR